MEPTASEFLRALRGSRSQQQLARRLGYVGNPITEWERGRRFPNVHEALEVARVCGLDVAAAFARFAPSVPLERRGSRFAIAAWLSAVRGGTSMVELAQRAQRSRYSVGRWLSGKATPRLPDFLRLLDAITGRLPDWLAEFVPIEQVPSLASRHAAARAARRLAFDAPWTEAILRLLETTSYRRQRGLDDRWLAEHLGISVETVRSGIDHLLMAGLVRRQGRHYVAEAPATVDTHAPRAALASLKQHWSRVAAERVATARDQDLFAYNVVSVAAADLQRIKQLLRATFREIRSIVAGSAPEEVAALINLQLVAFVPAAEEDATATPQRSHSTVES